MRRGRFERRDREAFVRLINMFGTEWAAAIGDQEYRNSTSWNLLIRIWDADRVKMSTAYEFMRDVKSPTTKRHWIQKAIADGILECSDVELARKLKSGETTSLPRGHHSPNIWLNKKVAARIDLFLDNMLEQILKTGDEIRSPGRLPAIERRRRKAPR